MSKPPLTPSLPGFVMNFSLADHSFIFTDYSFFDTQCPHRGHSFEHGGAGQRGESQGQASCIHNLYRRARVALRHGAQMNAR